MNKTSFLRKNPMKFWIVGLVLSVLLYLILSFAIITVIENQVFLEDIFMTDEEWRRTDRNVTLISLLISGIFFVTVTLFFQSVRSKREMKLREEALEEEKRQLIRTLSHDIRTPLTSILAYSELMAAKEQISEEEQRQYLDLVQGKTKQIKEMTDMLLDGSKRNLENFEHARVLMEQLAFELEEALEDRFSVELDLEGCSDFSGVFDVMELRRITDNLITNIEKYADPSHPVRFSVTSGEEGLVFHQTNHVRKDQFTGESYQVGLNSIRWIANKYKGHVKVIQDLEEFEITITLCDFSMEI